MTIEKAAKLISEGNYSIYNDNNNFFLLKRVLKVAFPEDALTEKFDFHESIEDNYYGCDRVTVGEWANVGVYLEKLNIINLSEITEKEKLTLVLKESKNHYDNSKGSLYQFCEDKQLNSYEFDIIKRIMRCRKKGQFREDLEKTKFLIDLYLTETNH